MYVLLLTVREIIVLYNTYIFRYKYKINSRRN